MMRRRFLLTLIVANSVSLFWLPASQAAFTLTDKNNANPQTFTNSASDVYVMETKDTQPPTAPGNVAGFTFNTQNGRRPNADQQCQRRQAGRLQPVAGW